MIPNFGDFIRKYNLKDVTLNESEIKKNFQIYPRDSQRTTIIDLYLSITVAWG